VIVIDLFKIYLLEYLSFWIYSLSIPFIARVLRDICAVRNDVDVITISVGMYVALPVGFSTLPE
jgi:hypothetical protein